MNTASPEIVADVTAYLEKLQALSVDAEELPNLLQAYGVRKHGDVLSVWNRPASEGVNRFDVRLGGDEAASPLVVTWTYKPAA